jgi:lysozyme family protein
MNMDRNFARSLSLVLQHEGGWSDHPKDPGGATMKGVTLATFRRFIEPTATKDDLRHITDAQIASIYRKQYWDAVKGDDLPDGIDYAVFDYAVNSGPGRAAKHLQSIVGAKQDGKIGPDTIAKSKAMLRASVINGLCDKRMAFLRGLPTWPTFGKGWTSRVTAVRSVALAMIPVTVTIKPVPQPTPQPAYVEKNPFWRALFAILKAIFGRK